MKVRWGVIGGGGIADRRTIPGLLLAGNAELTAVMEVDMGLAQKLAQKYGAKYAFDSAEKLLECAEVDAVYIASPVAYHAEQIKLAADAKKYILVEKPVALTSAGAQDAADYCARHGVLLAAGFMMRFAAYHQKMKELITDGRLGNVVTASGQFTCWYPDIKGAWRQYKAQSGGGALMDMGVHVIDLLQYIMDSRIVKVAAMCDTKTFGYDVDDSSALLVEYANGAYGNINSNFNIPDEAAKWRIEFYGTQGRLVGNATIGQAEGGDVDAVFTDAFAGYDAQQDKKESDQVDLSVELGNMYTKEIESFGNSILTGSKLECPASDAVYVQKVVEAAYESAKTGRMVSLQG